MILSISVGMGSHAQGALNDKFTKPLQYLKNGQVCWLGCVMGIISLCQSKSVTNYFYLKNEDREPGSSSNVLLFFKPCCFKLGYFPIYWKLFNTWNFSELYWDFSLGLASLYHLSIQRIWSIFKNLRPVSPVLQCVGCEWENSHNYFL